MTGELTGTVEMKSKINRFSNATRKAMVNAVWEFERIEMGEMKRLVPVDTGELMDSGFYTKPQFEKGDILTARMGFSADHALVVHEDLEAFHSRGQAKYFEEPWEQARPHFNERVAESMRAELGL